MTNSEVRWLAVAMTLFTVSSQIPDKFSVPQMLPPDHSYAHPDFTSYDPSGPLPDLNMVIVHNSSFSTSTSSNKESTPPLIIIPTPISNDIFETDLTGAELNVPLTAIEQDSTKKTPSKLQQLNL
uniref:Kidney androgen-regulated protein-like n=1 Tax=Heterorhabditis bacteriophora TaxID=37862 RepID=A0A1I7WRU2_HETBA